MQSIISLLAIFSLFNALFVHGLPLHAHHVRSQVERIKRSHSSSSNTTDAGTYLAPAPRWVTYSDAEIDGGNTVVPSSEQLKGFNVFILAFYLTSGASDQLQNWVSLSSSKRSAILKDLHDNNISLMFSVFGSTETPTTSGVDPSSFASEVASFAKKYKFDGVDVDYEDFDAFNSKSSKAFNWLKTFHTSLRSHLPSGQYLLSAAPVAPWFTDSKDAYPGGSYLDLELKTKSQNAIDFYNIQFYNQGTLYSTCSHLVSSSPGGEFPHTSVGEIHKNGVSLDKLVIGKPALSSDADGSGDQGFMSSGSLKSCMNQAKEDLGWNAGMMFWEYHHSSITSLVATVREIAFPILGGL